jgi:hypothetical protein
MIDSGVSPSEVIEKLKKAEDDGFHLLILDRHESAVVILPALRFPGKRAGKIGPDIVGTVEIILDQVVTVYFVEEKLEIA